MHVQRLALERFGQKKVDNLLEAIEKSKQNSLDKFIFGLGIRFIGAKAAKTLAKRYKSITEVKNATYEELVMLLFNMINKDYPKEWHFMLLS